MAKIWSPIQFCSSHSQEITHEEIQLANLNFMQVMIGRVSFESCGCPLSIVLSIPKFDTPLHSLEIHNPRNGHPHWHSSSLPGSKMSEGEHHCQPTTWWLFLLQNSYWSFKPCKPGCIRICDFPYLESLESLIKQASEGSVAAEHTSKCWQCEKRSVHRIPANSAVFAIICGTW